jgi:hypothetical protein
MANDPNVNLFTVENDNVPSIRQFPKSLILR